MFLETLDFHAKGYRLAGKIAYWPIQWFNNLGKSGGSNVGEVAFNGLFALCKIILAIPLVPIMLVPTISIGIAAFVINTAMAAVSLTVTGIISGVKSLFSLFCRDTSGAKKPLITNDNNDSIRVNGQTQKIYKSFGSSVSNDSSFDADRKHTPASDEKTDAVTIKLPNTVPTQDEEQTLSLRRSK